MDGAHCEHTLSAHPEDLTGEQFLEMLEANPGDETHPKHGAALCQSPEDFAANKLSLELACQKIKCDKEVLDAVARMDTLLKQVKP